MVDVLHQCECNPGMVLATKTLYMKDKHSIDQCTLSNMLS